MLHKTNRSLSLLFTGTRNQHNVKKKGRDEAQKSKCSLGKVNIHSQLTWNYNVCSETHMTLHQATNDPQLLTIIRQSTLIITEKGLVCTDSLEFNGLSASNLLTNISYNWSTFFCSFSSTATNQKINKLNTTKVRRTEFLLFTCYARNGYFNFPTSSRTFHV